MESLPLPASLTRTRREQSEFCRLAHQDMRTRHQQGQDFQGQEPHKHQDAAGHVCNYKG